jgi:uncharacterized lipoprotein YmbA
VNRQTRTCWLACVLAGCAATPENHYYRLSPAAAVDTAAAFPESSNTTLTVDLPALLDRLEIVESTGPHTVAIREFDRWAAPLDEMVPQVLGEDLAMAELGQRGADDRPSDDRHLVIHIDEFMAGADGIVHLGGTWSVLGNSGTRQRWRFSFQTPADPRQISTIAASMSRLLDRLAATIASTS